MEKHSTVKIRETQEFKTVKISSGLKPEIITSVINKWQTLLDSTAKIVQVPSALIMRLNETTIEVFLSSKTNGNPYKAGEEAKLIYGLYCETVIGTQKKLLVADATKSPIWKKNNPDVDIHMISYLGYPLNWPDGESFGTVCLLDNKENNYSKEYINLLENIKQHIETDLQLLITNKELNEKKSELEKLNSTKTRFLSLISHDVRGTVAAADEFLKLIIENLNDYDKPMLGELLNSLSQNITSSYLTLENLLNWSKIDFVQLEPIKSQVDIVDVIEKLLAYFQQAIIIKDLEIIKEYYSKNAFISFDENMLIVCLRNIISNAIKYNKKGGKIIIRVLHNDQNHSIEIEDTGIGMKESSIVNLFKYDNLHRNQFTQGEISAGIGLVITKDFLDKNNAVIEVESKIGKGSNFKIILQ